MTNSYLEVKNFLLSLGYISLNNGELDRQIKNNGLYVNIMDDNGYKYFSRYADIDKHHPFIVDNSNPYSLENISLWLKLNNKDFKLCKDNKYINSLSKLKFFHLKCKEYFYMNWTCISHNYGCAVCDGHQIGKYNNLEYLEPELSKEWIESEHNLTPKDVTIGSLENVHWECIKCNHLWWRQIKYRTSNGDGCPNCAENQKESKVASGCKKYFIENYNAIPEYKILKNPETNKYLPFDIYISYKKVFIEIHGEQHYRYKSKFCKNQEEFEHRKYLDRLKKDFAEQNGTYVEVDLRKIKSVEVAIEYINSILLNIK